MSDCQSFEHAAHVLMWDVIANMTDEEIEIRRNNKPGIPMEVRLKNYAFNNYIGGERPIKYCYACSDCDFTCKKCPLNWPELSSCLESRSLFSKFTYIFCHNSDFNKLRHMAATIRDLPWEEKR